MQQCQTPDDTFVPATMFRNAYALRNHRNLYTINCCNCNCSHNHNHFKRSHPLPEAYLLGKWNAYGCNHTCLPLYVYIYIYIIYGNQHRYPSCPPVTPTSWFNPLSIQVERCRRQLLRVPRLPSGRWSPSAAAVASSAS